MLRIPKQTRQGHCSWCFKHTRHYRTEFNVIRRPCYVCDQCQQRTIPCRLLYCRNMTRGYPSHDDELCLKHKRLIQSFENPEDVHDSLSRIAYCSHCLELSEHHFYRISALQVLIFLCSNPTCQQQTILCTSQGCNSMAKKNTLLKNQCLVCSETIASWNDSLPTVELFCSSCYSRSTFTCLTESSLRCQDCRTLATRCKSCDVGTAKSTGLRMFKGNCLACSEQRSWESVRDGMEELRRIDLYDLDFNSAGKFAKTRMILMNRINSNIEPQQLAEVSHFKIPYLLLSSMTPFQRVSSADALGLGLSEAMGMEKEGKLSVEICSRLRSLTRESHEYIPFTGTPNYYKTIQRCVVLLFGQCQNSSDDSDAASLDPDSTDLLAIENELLERLCKYQRAKFSKELVNEIESFVDDDALSLLNERLSLKGYSSTAVRCITDSLAIALKFSGNQIPVLTLNTIMSLVNMIGINALRPLTPFISGFLFPIVGVISLALISFDVVDLVLGSDLAKAFPVVVQLLFQKLVLLLNDVHLGDFF
ncbi:hypothetical protein P9112_000923 [Eukaryota sp. TZLM1-RC]